MSEHDKIIERMKYVLDALDETPVQAASNEYPSSTIRELASEILLKSCAKYPIDRFAMD
ncbi:hypothetical protein GTGU_04096 [Trabulsiella guamensis ATCC 49490]|uniref:Uncharacterized protein n=1 Tax=Trabulsiella guamensis ATCC 49490 TaxID=1005994 RepID=A0A084ZQB3_9ENTR|nr:hypothetical protein [Trabulsiella guamensis]KFB99657.1 hypothetical protein GTGU_04096 [Trabulsiella guamensis ATCC 49490]